MPAAAAEPTAADIAASAVPATDNSGADQDFLTDALKFMATGAEDAAKPADPAATAKPEPKAAAEPDKKPAVEQKKPDDVLATLKPGSKDYNWAQLKKEKEDAIAKLQAAEAKLNAIPADLQAKLDAIQKERDDLSRRLEESDIERHPKFQSHFNGGLDRLEAQVKDIVAGENGERIAEIIRGGDFKRNSAALNELMDGLSTAEIAQVGAILTSGRQLHAERAAELARAGERRKELQAAEEQARAQQIQTLTKQFEAKIQEAAAGDPLFQKRDGEEYRDWNAKVEERLSQARNILTGQLTHEDAVNAAMWAASAPEYRELLDAQIQLNAKLKAQLDALTAARPTAGSEKAAGSNPGTDPETLDAWVAEQVKLLKS